MARLTTIRDLLMRPNPIPRNARFTQSAAIGALAMFGLLGAAMPAVAAAPPPVPTAKPDGFKRTDPAAATELQPAGKLFKQASTAASLSSGVFGKYTRGCLAGAEQLATDGPGWQAMRLSRNRHWGHPNMVRLIQKLASDVTKLDGWPGLLVGDIAMPRGGPMWPSHSSHQHGLDADIWLTPMPDRKFTNKERETTSAVYMLTRDQLAINPDVWTEGQERIIKRAATYPSVQRILVHPAIKKQLCEKAKSRGEDTSWLSKVRPVWGHNYHFHIRMHCPAGSPQCAPQIPTPTVDGCGEELDDWYKRLEARLKPRKPSTEPRKPRAPRRLITMADLPAACQMVLTAK